MSRPCVTIITSAYRSEKYLQRFLESVASQTVAADLELVLVLNDPSPAENAILESWAPDFRGRLVALRTGREPIGRSWNRCLECGEGTAFAIWNVDDVRTPSSIGDQISLIRAGADVVFGDYDIAFDEVSMKPARRVTTADWGPDDLRREMRLGPFFMFSRRAFEATGFFDEQFRAALDYDYALRLMGRFTPERTQSVLGTYFDGGIGLSTGSTSVQPVERTAIRLRYGIYDDLDVTLIPEALAGYDLRRVVVGDAVAAFAPPVVSAETQRRQFIASAIRTFAGYPVRGASRAAARRASSDDAVGRALRIVRDARRKMSQ